MMLQVSVARQSLRTGGSVTDEYWKRRRTVFGTFAAHYDRARPTFPQDAVAWLCGDPVNPADVDVLDLGAGTGKLTRALAAAGYRVVSVEPSEGMREVLSATSPGASVLAGSAESIPLPDASVDVVTSGQAMHWFELPVALPEITRVLRPGGLLSAVWNLFDDSVDWVSEFCDLTKSEAQYSRVETIGDAWLPWFPAPEQADFRHHVVLQRADLVALAESFSMVVLMPDDERLDVLNRVESLIAAGEQLVLPYVADAHRSRRPK